MRTSQRHGGRGVFSRFALAAALALGATACGSAPKSGETLMESLFTYHEGIRWQRFAAAAGRLPPDERSHFIDEWDERSRDLKVTDYEIVDVVQRGDEATVQVKISWYGDTEGKLHDTHARQSWQRRGKTWILIDEVRARGPQMPGLTEPVTDGAAGDAADGPGVTAANGAGGTAGLDAAKSADGAKAADEGP